MSFATPSGGSAPGGFATPSQFPQSSFNVADHLGSLVIITVNNVELTSTVNGERTTIRCGIEVLAGPGAGDVEPDALLFQLALVRVCRTAWETNGRRPTSLLGRFILGVAGKPGQNAPYLLEDPTSEDMQLAQAFVQNGRRLPYNPAPPQQYQQPQQAPPPPQQPQWQQPPAQPPQQPYGAPTWPQQGPPPQQQPQQQEPMPYPYGQQSGSASTPGPSTGLPHTSPWTQPLPPGGPPPEVPPQSSEPPF